MPKFEALMRALAVAQRAVRELAARGASARPWVVRVPSSSFRVRAGERFVGGPSDDTKGWRRARTQKILRRTRGVTELAALPVRITIQQHRSVGSHAAAFALNGRISAAGEGYCGREPKLPRPAHREIDRGRSLPSERVVRGRPTLARVCALSRRGRGSSIRHSRSGRDHRAETLEPEGTHLAQGRCELDLRAGCRCGMALRRGAEAVSSAARGSGSSPDGARPRSLARGQSFPGIEGAGAGRAIRVARAGAGSTSAGADRRRHRCRRWRRAGVSASRRLAAPAQCSTGDDAAAHGRGARQARG
jgi:hypothetical protein